ncbi:glycosyltransferase family 2 protein [Haloferax volcanii]|uniref:glycosyltransferase family 2 protein n=1 Tax=Haloferax volcanii TaxID=2246 RepID=UPI00385500CE
MSSLSVLIPTKNSYPEIERCLKSVKPIADEIIILDSYSSDQTVEECQDYGCKVIQQEFEDFSDLRERLLQEASNEWVLFIDSDEEVTTELQESILSAIKNASVGAYELKRRDRMFDHWMIGFDSNHLRLGRKTDISITSDIVHEEVEYLGEGSPIVLDGYLNHHTYSSISEYLDKFDQYTSLEALKHEREGSHPSIFLFILKGIVVSCKYGIVNKAILNGYAGLLFIAFSFMYRIVTYGKIKEIQEYKRQNPDDWESQWIKKRCSR